MTAITRRDALRGAGAVVAVAGVTGAVQAVGHEEEQVLTLFRQMGDRERASAHFWMRYYAGLPDDPQIRQRFTGEAES